MANKKDLNDEELQKVSGGVININNDWGCQYKPSRWERAPFATGGIGMCASCVHNNHRAWKESQCDVENEYLED